VGEEHVCAPGAACAEGTVCSASIFSLTNIFFVLEREIELPRKFVPERASAMRADATRRHEIIDRTPLQPGHFLHSRTPSALNTSLQ